MLVDIDSNRSLYTEIYWVVIGKIFTKTINFFLVFDITMFPKLEKN